MLVILVLKSKIYYKHKNGFYFYCARKYQGKAVVFGLPSDFVGPIKREDIEAIEHEEILLKLNPSSDSNGD